MVEFLELTCRVFCYNYQFVKFGVHKLLFFTIDESLQMEKPASLRRDKTDVFDSDIQATPEFRTFVAGKLSEILDKSLLMDESDRPDQPSKKKDSKSRHQGVKLFSASKSYFSPKETSDKHQTKFKTRPDLLAHRKQLKSEEAENEAFKSMAVTPEWVLEQHGVHYKGPDESRSKIITEL